MSIVYCLGVRTRDETREQVAAWMIQHGLVTGHGDRLEDLLDSLGWQIEVMREKLRTISDVCYDTVGEDAHRDDYDEALMEIWHITQRTHGSK